MGSDGVAGKDDRHHDRYQQRHFECPPEVWVAPASPGIFTFSFGPGAGIVQNFKLTAEDDILAGSFAQPDGFIPGVPAQPAAIGGVIILWSNGLGPLNMPVATGEASGAENPILFAEKTVRVFIGGQEAQVLAAFLQQTNVGLNQINAIVPEGVEPGDAVPIVVEVDCGDGNVFRSRDDVTIAVRPRP
jgi:uncharacterized protein (TIGR03437 family)